MPSESNDAFRAPVGTHDILPPDSGRWAALVAAFATRAANYGYGLVITPIFEHREVFVRVGASTDVVRKEMYDFEDKGGRAIALRPEGTAPVVRAYVQHRPPSPWKVWYAAPNFRYERPQKGRYRQHFQVGVEALGVDDPDIDVEVIALAHGFYRALGLRRFRLLVNSMGDAESRPRYRDALQTFLRPHSERLGPEFAQRVEDNPLRVLDSKNPDVQSLVADAPKLVDYLGAESRDHFERVQAGLTALGIEHEIEPRMVRGFDYYTRTVFEFQSDALDGAQNAIGGGGRYDTFAEDMGGPPTPGIGFGLGVERILIACDAEGVFATEDVALGATLDAFIVDMVADGTSVPLLEELRAAGISADRTYGGRSVKAQWKAADRSGARFAVILGKEEAAAGSVGLKDLGSGEQVTVPRAEIVAAISSAVTDTPATQQEGTTP
jgi:histidyl-tRNA synthetase